MSRPIRCSRCHQVGHNIRTCSTVMAQALPQALPQDQAPMPQAQAPMPQAQAQAQVQAQAQAMAMAQDQPLFDTLCKITICNLKNQNYLLYWVNGNSSFMDLDDMENQILAKGLILGKSSINIEVIPGDRFHLVPHSMNVSPPYHPSTDREFFIEPYVTIDIPVSGDIPSIIHIDDKDQLSQENLWKFKALKLDFLMKQVIKLGGMKCDNLAPILDLHQDIDIPYHTELDKEWAGVPSTFTNLT